eukprot:scaffold2798_cov160-Ochromonas_danica.AAC.25
MIPRNLIWEGLLVNDLNGIHEGFKLESIDSRPEPFVTTMRGSVMFAAVSVSSSLALAVSHMKN